MQLLGFGPPEISAQPVAEHRWRGYFLDSLHGSFNLAIQVDGEDRTAAP